MDEEPELLLKMPPWHRVFLANLSDALLPRRQSPLPLTSSPAPFWPDVFVPRRIPLAAMRQSMLVHAFVITLIWGLAQAGFLAPRTQPLANPYANEKITYYSVSEYLPPIDTGRDPVVAAKKGQPEYARQPIISLPHNADNRSQTIVSPYDVHLEQEVSLPNIVAGVTAKPMTLPVASILRGAIKVALPPPSVEPPSVARMGRTDLPRLNPLSVAGPPAAIENPQLLLPPELVMPAVLAPTPRREQPHPLPEVASTVVVAPAPIAIPARKLDDLNLARSKPAVSAPQLLIPEQRSASTALLNHTTVTAMAPPISPRASERSAALANAVRSAAVAALPPGAGLQEAGGGRATVIASSADAPAVAPPPPTLGPPLPQQAKNGIAGDPEGGQNSSGRFLALNLHPAVAAGPIEIPAGNRRGSFAATPQGMPGAPGTPDIPEDAAGFSPQQAKSGLAGDPGIGKGSGGPEGIYVGAAPQGPGAQATAVVSGPMVQKAPAEAAAPPSAPGHSAELLATATPPLLGLGRLARPVAPQERKAEDKVFGARKYYQMAINMPNLTSTGGSWVVRFAELRQNREKGDLTAPVVIVKVDPAYPPDLIRAHVEGTVVLYAVIRADGGVSEVRVLRGLEERLDENACIALAKWRFRPGTKNGSAVDLEAVVQVPFVSTAAQF